MFCVKCGNEIADNADFCPKCGSAVSKKAGISSKSRLAAVLLAFFFGYLGVHDFYIGRIKSGVTKLLLMIFGVLICVAGGLLFVGSIVYDEIVQPEMFEFSGKFIAYILCLVVGGFMAAVPSVWGFIDFILAACGVLKDGNGMKITEWE